MFWVISVYFNIRNTLPKSGTFLLGHPVYIYIYIYKEKMNDANSPSKQNLIYVQTSYRLRLNIVNIKLKKITVNMSLV